MGDPGEVTERGVLTAPAEVWQVAVRRAGVIGRLAGGDVVGHGAADAAAAELDISRRRVYELLRRWRAGSGLVSDLIPGGEVQRGPAAVADTVIEQPPPDDPDGPLPQGPGDVVIRRGPDRVDPWTRVFGDEPPDAWGAAPDNR